MWTTVDRNHWQSQWHPHPALLLISAFPPPPSAFLSVSTAKRRIDPKKTAAGNPAKRWIEMFLEYSRSECHLSDNTVAAYRRDLVKFAAWLGQRKIQELTIRELADYPAWLNDRKLAPASIARHLVSLKVFFRYLQLEAVLKENLAELLGSQKLWQRVPHVLSPEMIDKLLEAPQRHDPLWRRDRALLELLYATGCRASEVSNLRQDDVHLTQGFCLARGKGDKERLVPLGRRAILAIEEYLTHDRPMLFELAQFPPRWLLLSRRGRRLRRERIWELVKQYALRVGAPVLHRPAHLTAQFRHAPLGRRRRFASSPRTPRPRQHPHDANLHPRRSDAAEENSPAVSPARVNSEPNATAKLSGSPARLSCCAKPGWRPRSALAGG